MKELSIEEKEKAYDERLAKARKEYSIHKANNAIGIMDALERVFPELKESDGERIRKAIIKHFKTGTEYVSFSGFSKGEIINWVEKQCEQKSTEEYNITGIGSKNAQGKLGKMIKKLKPVNEVLEQKPADKTEPKFKKGDVIRRKDGDGLEWTVEDLHKDGYYTIVNSDRDDFVYLDDNWELVEQKPAEWSKEDENLFACAIDAVKQESKVRADGCLDEEVGGMVIDWLNSLKDRVQPKQ